MDKTDKMGKIYKTFRANVKEVDEENGIIDMAIPLSTGSMDRDGEVVEPIAFKKSLVKFRKRPVLVSSHDYRDLQKQIGEFKTIKVNDDGLIGTPKYYINEGNPEADWAFKLAAKGMAAFSVGFIPIDFEDGDGEKSPKRTYKEAELLEVSQVIVPSNRDAIQGIRSKSVDPVMIQLLDDIESAEIVDLIEAVTKPEETDEYVRIPVSGEAGKHDSHRIRTIAISEKEGIKALYCGEDKVAITYLFAKDHDWTMERAREWMKEHEKIAGDKSLEATQQEICDELDYLIKLIESKGMNEDVKDDAWRLVREIMRLSGSDIPVDIQAKIGAVLNLKNKSKLKDAQTLIQEVISSAGIDPEKAAPESEINVEDLKSAVKEVFSEMRGK